MVEEIGRWPGLTIAGHADDAAIEADAATRSNGFETVLSQYPNLKKVATEVAGWDRTQDFNKMQSMLQANPDIDGVISGNDEMALGAISALKQARVACRSRCPAMVCGVVG